MPQKKQEFNKEIGNTKPLDIISEMRNSYISYAMSVIVARALPDVRDGLKPVQRRILYTMYEMGLTAGAKFRKSAAINGSVLARYHPHGDAAVYAAMARMAQDFSLRYPLVKPQGNFGSMDGDPPAAARYTEAKLSKMGELMLKDIQKDTVEFTENYDGSRKEPTVLPSPLPQLLLNGSFGIAVGVATKIPPHNLSELCDAVSHMIDHPEAGIGELFQFIHGPDFPTGGIIYDKEQIIEAYSRGKGPILVRGRAEIVEGKRGFQIVISEIPFGIQKIGLLQQFARLVQEKKLKKIRDIRDESGQEGLRIVFELKEGAQPKRILNFLYKHTLLQTTFHLNMVALEEGIQPKVLGLTDILHQFIFFRKTVILRRTKFDKSQAAAREHILEGFHKALKNIDEVIKTIKASKDRTNAQKNLIQKFKLTAIQSDAILNMRLSSLAKLEQKKIEDELKAVKAEIEELSSILNDPKKINAIIKKDTEQYKKDFGDNRKTKIFTRKVQEITSQDLIPREPAVVMLTQKGLIKRLKPSVYRVQKRGGKGVIGAKTKEDDIVKYLIFTNTHDDLLFFTDSGKVFKTKVFEIPEETRISQGKSLMNFLEISSQEKVLAVASLSERENKDTHFIMATQNGLVKKTKISDFINVRRSGLIAINLKSGDLLKQVRRCSKGDRIILVTVKGKSIKFNESDVRNMGRQAAGVKGIRLAKEDRVIAMEIIRRRTEKDKKKGIKRRLLVISENGYGKRTGIWEYRVQKRGGTGIKTANITKKTGELVAARILDDSNEYLIIISQKAQVIKINLNGVSKMGRATQGVRIIRLGSGDKVASIAHIKPDLKRNHKEDKMEKVELITGEAEEIEAAGEEKKEIEQKEKKAEVKEKVVRAAGKTFEQGAAKETKKIMKKRVKKELKKKTKKAPKKKAGKGTRVKAKKKAVEEKIKVGLQERKKKTTGSKIKITVKETKKKKQGDEFKLIKIK